MASGRRRKRARAVGFGVGALVVALAVLYVARMKGDLPRDVVEARWTDASSRFLNVGGMRVHYRDEGSGPPLLLLHGTAASLHTWDGWVASLRARHRVVRFDLPGFGLTGPSASRNYSIAAYVAAVDELARRLDLAPFVLAGNSLGGEIAWQYARAHPTRVRALILVDAAGYPRYGDDVPFAFRIASWPIVPRALAKLDPRRMVNQAVRKVYGDPARIRLEVAQRYYELALAPGNRDAFVDRMRMPRLDQSAAIRDLRQPTLIMWGALDRLIPADNARLFARDIPGSRLVIYDDLGHVPMEEDAVRTVADVDRFLASLAPPTTGDQPTSDR
jgi:pimeloyl-ACP methyl ester carboxylesterase